MRLDDPNIGLELLEYKIDALRRDRPVRGGREAVASLRWAVEAAATRLDEEGRRRLAEAARAVDALVPAPDAPAAPRRGDVRFEELDLGDGGAGARTPRETSPDPGPFLDASAERAAPEPASAAERRERDALGAIAGAVLEREVDRFAAEAAARWRSDPDRLGARLLHAVVRNLERHRATPAFAGDGDLRAFEVLEPVPLRRDPLLSFSDVAVLAIVARDAADAVLRLHDGDGPAPVDRRAALGWVRRLAERVARDPWAGRATPLPAPGPSAAELRAALRDLARERLPDWQRRMRREELEARLRERSEADRRDREVFRRDVARFEAEVGAYFGRLSRLLPRSVGGEAPEPRPPTRVLFAATPAVRIEAVPEGARRATVRLGGPTRFRFAGREAVVTGDAGDRRLHLGPLDLALDRDRATPFDGRTLAIFVAGDHLHLRLEGGGALAARVAEAAVALHAVAASDAPTLAAFRRIAPDGPAEPADLVVHVLREAAAADATPAEAARRLVERIGEAAASAGAAPAEAWSAALARLVRLAFSPEGLDAAVDGLAAAASGAIPHLAPFDGGPTELPLGGRSVVVRRYGTAEDPVVALVEGRPLGVFRERLVAPFRGGWIVLVHGEERLAAVWARPRGEDVPTRGRSV